MRLAGGRMSVVATAVVLASIVMPPGAAASRGPVSVVPPGSGPTTSAGSAVLQPGVTTSPAVTPAHVDVQAAARDAHRNPRPQPRSLAMQPIRHAAGGGPAASSPVAPRRPDGRGAGTAASLARHVPAVRPIAATAPRSSLVTPAPGAPLTSPYTALFLDGAPGALYFGDEVDTYTLANATFSPQVTDDNGTAAPGNVVFVEGDGPNGPYEVEFVGPNKLALTTGTYNSAVFPPNAGVGQAGMFVAAHNTVCSNGVGNFVVTELTTTGTTLDSLAASFTWNCTGGTDPGIIGEIRYQAATGLSAMSIHPSPDALGTQPVGVTTAAGAVTITNDGSTTLTLGTVAASGSTAFALATDTCSGQTLAAGSSCSLGPTVHPAAPGAIAGKLAWTDDSTRASHEVDLSATGFDELATTVAGGVAGAAIDIYATIETSPAQTCTSTCAYDVSALAGSMLRVVARPPAGSTFTGFTGACNGRAPCVLPVTTSQSVTATFAPILTPGPASLRVVDGQAGYRDSEFGCPATLCLEPPDPVVAVSAAEVVSATNGTMRVRDRAGTLIADLPLWAFFTEPADTSIDGDPQVVWDAAASRWIASEFSASCVTGYLHVAISDGPDAAAGWTIYTFSRSGSVIDFPGLGISSDKVVVGGNLFDLNSVTCELGSFQAGTIYAMPLATMLAGGSLAAQILTDPGADTPRPAQVLDPTGSLPVVLDTGDTGSGPTGIGYLVVTGTGPATTFGPTYDLSEPSNLPPLQFGVPLAAPADPPTPAGFPAATGPVTDGRPLGAVVKGGDLWFGSTIACQPAGDATTRSCGRVTRVHLMAGTSATASSIAFGHVASVWVTSDSASGPLRFEVRWGTFPTGYPQPRAEIHYGTPATGGPLMFSLCPPPGSIEFCPQPWDWGGTLTAADFTASASVPTFAAAIAAINQGHAYLELYSDYGASTANDVRGALGQSQVVDRLVFDDIIATAGRDTFFPTVGMSGDGTTYLAAVQSAAGLPIQTVASSASAGAADGRFGAWAVVSRAQAGYAGARWGDYLAVVGDPADAHGAWMSQEFVTATGSWQAWSSRLLAGAGTAPAGTIVVDHGAASTLDPVAVVDLQSSGGTAATEARVSDSPTLSGGLLAKGRPMPLGRGSTWSLIEAAVGGTATTGTKTVYAQFGDGRGTWSAVVSASITLAANPAVTRFAGTDRYATAAAISAGSFSPGVPVAFIATGANFPDALAGAAVAGRIGAPVLLVTATTVPAATRTELARLKPDRLVILGGTGAVSDAVRLALEPYAPGGVFRISGANRYETAANIAFNYFFPGVPIAFIATGTNFPDALAGAAAAGVTRSPILLVSPTSVPAATSAALRYLAPKRIVILGGTGAVSAGVATALAAYTAGSVTRIAGADRYATAAAISRAFFPVGGPAVFVATGANFPDALAGAPVAGHLGVPVILVTATTIPASANVELNRLNPGRVVILGGTSVVSAAVALLLAASIGP